MIGYIIWGLLLVIAIFLLREKDIIAIPTLVASVEGLVFQFMEFRFMDYIHIIAFTAVAVEIVVAILRKNKIAFMDYKKSSWKKEDDF